MNQSVLIVEDDFYILESLSEFIESEGYNVLKAVNGKVALELLEEADQLPFAILLDLAMPIMNGFQFRIEQEKDPRLASIPIIVMSADPQIEIAKMKLGAGTFIKKPLDIEQLSLILKKYL